MTHYQISPPAARGDTSIRQTSHLDGGFNKTVSAGPEHVNAKVYNILQILLIS